MQSADQEDQAGAANKRTANKFKVSAMILDVAFAIDIGEEVPPAVLQLREHAAARAAYILKCIKTGEPILPNGHVEGSGGGEAGVDGVADAQRAQDEADVVLAGLGINLGGVSAPAPAPPTATVPPPAQAPAVDTAAQPPPAAAADKAIKADGSAVPAGLKPIKQYLQLAATFEGPMPGLAYYARLHAAGVGLATLRSPENDAYLIQLLDKCDADKATLLAKGDVSPTNAAHAVTEIMSLASKYCKQAADSDDAGMQNNRTVQTYKMAGIICEVVLSIEKEGAAVAPATAMKGHVSARADYLSSCFETGAKIMPPGQEGADIVPAGSTPATLAVNDELAGIGGGGGGGGGGDSDGAAASVGSAAEPPAYNTPGLAAVVASAAFVANFTWTDNPLSIAHLTIDGNMYVRALSLSLSISLSFSQSLSLSLFPVAFQHIKRVVW